MFLKHRKAIAAWTVVVAGLVSVWAVLSPTSYTAQGSFLPQQSDASQFAGVSALANQFGITVPSGDLGHSPYFYADLLRSRELLGPILTDTLRVREVSWGDTTVKSGTTLDLLEVEADTPALRRKRGIEWLQEEAISASVVDETGLVELAVTTPWPEMSYHIVSRLIELVNAFNLQSRQSQAGAERAFVEDRLHEAQAALREAEDSLKQFLENNRAFQNSPELRFQHDRLERQVNMRQEVFTSLSQSYEEARISEVRNTPVITVVERPEIPPVRDPRRLILRGIIGLVVGAMLGTLFAFGREMVASSREQEGQQYMEFKELWATTVADLRRPWRLLRRNQARG